MQSVKLYLVVLFVFLCIDLTWLTAMQGFYSRELGDLVRRHGERIAPRWEAAWLVYALIPLGLVAFVNPRLGPAATAWQALGWGALFGLVAYGVYDLTNLAILRGWSVRMTVIDLLWGSFLCGIVSIGMQYARR